MKRFKEFRNQGVLTIFDIDETLFHTAANVLVRNQQGKLLRKLDNREFNTYVRAPGEVFDFSEFQSAELFYHTSKPIDKMFKRIKAIMRSKRNPNSKVIILTARSDFDNKELFLDTFRKHGLTEIDDIHVHRAGNLPVSAAEGKKVFVEEYLKTNKFYKARLFDDAQSNLRMFNQLAPKYPNVDFESYEVYPDGSVKRFESI